MPFYTSLRLSDTVLLLRSFDVQSYDYGPIIEWYLTKREIECGADSTNWTHHILFSVPQAFDWYGVAFPIGYN